MIRLGLAARRRLGLVLAAALLLAGCDGGGPVLRVVSGSENEGLEPMVRDWAEDAGVTVEIDYRGSVEIARELARGADGDYDAVWPAHSLWLALGDTGRVVRHEASVLRSPIVLALKTAIAEDLGWTGRDDVTVAEIAEAAREGAFRLAMTSATQSNSGAQGYLGFLYAYAGNPDVLTLNHLDDPAVREGVGGLLSEVDRSSGSSGWLRRAFVENPHAFDAMINYEAMAIEANRAFLLDGEPALHVVYPADAPAVADSPLAYVERGQDEAVERAFLDLQAHLLSPEVQRRLFALGRRAGLIGLSLDDPDRRVWNPDWGIDPNRAIAPLPTPSGEVVRAALALYQEELRKPSATVWVLDVSGSMEGEPLAELKRAMRLVLDPEAAASAMLQPTPRDVTVVIAFNDRVAGSWRVDGADPQALGALLAEIEGLGAGGGTDLYAALVGALDRLDGLAAEGGFEARLPAIVAMTDGESDTENRARFLARLEAAGFAQGMPIHAVAFGQADEDQLGALAEATVGRLFLAGDDLAGTLRKVKGYN
ncbi:MAG: substrate-binding domain-containing protein [Paracoccaceae bacterium]